MLVCELCHKINYPKGNKLSFHIAASNNFNLHNWQKIRRRISKSTRDDNISTPHTIWLISYLHQKYESDFMNQLIFILQLSVPFNVSIDYTHKKHIFYWSLVYVPTYWKALFIIDFYNVYFFIWECWGSHNALNICMSGSIFLWGPEDDPSEVKTCSPNTIILCEYY